MEDAVNDFAALKSMLTDDELVYDEALMPPESRALWSRIAAGESDLSSSRDLFPLSFSVPLPRGLKLSIHLGNADAKPAFSVRGSNRSLQEQIAGQLPTLAEQAGNEEMPMFQMFTLLEEYISGLPVNEQNGSRVSQQDQTASKNSARAGIVQSKCALLWSHHLLATSKRKDLQAWSSELQVWTLSKIGYPGVIVVQGLLDDVDEILRRIRALQWYALQTRYEVASKHQALSDDEVVQKELPLRLAVVAGPQATEKVKPQSREVDSMSDLSSLMTQAGLRDIFATAMKLPTHDNR